MFSFDLLATRRKPNAHRRRVVGTAAAAAVALVLSACGYSSTAASSSTAAVSPAAAAVSPAAADGSASGVDFSGVTLRIGETGYATQQLLLKSAGLDNTPYLLTGSVFQGGNLQLEALGAGAIDLASASEIPPIFAAQSGGAGSLVTVAVRQGTTLLQEVVVPAGSAIKTVADLKGKKVAYVQNTTAHLFLFESLERAGLKWSDITPVALSTSDGLAALLAGQVDALASYGNAIVTAHAKGATTMVDAKDLLSGNYPFLVLPKTLKDPKLVAAIEDFFSREQRAYNWARAHPDDWAAVVAAQTKQPVAQAKKTFVDGEKQRPSRFVTITDAQIISQQGVLDTFVKAGLIKKSFDIKPFWTTALNPAITKIEGEYVAG
ncbi:sulfonate transport system substrate-binding protein [Nakamurella sp. UYEF19]|uniref:ABC transporter substrate-binding protein n=1 Tax=Nakamurella sp. UYEF19 TaxID=1756392 RepID=UPI003396BF4C